ncbi:hypothetical protein MHYP_G00142700 [Metynnis hypsauchen]
MRVLLIITTFVVMAGAASFTLTDQEFHAWKVKYDKSYGSVEEESRRKMIWLDNLKMVQEHNMLADQGLKSYRLGMNHFADMDNQEFQARFSGCLESFNMTKLPIAPADFKQIEGAAPPNSIDWRTMGYVTPVENQGSCNSCWAFSAAGALEAQMYRKTFKLVSLSKQQLVDCSKAFGNIGCKGGFPHSSFEYVASGKGLEAESTYPYKAKNVVATCRSATFLTSGDENNLLNAVATVGPISAGMDASRPSLKLYMSGVYDEPNCSTKVNHAILIVGYGTDAKKNDYWLVKNSWGVNWGDNGYIKMSRNKNNQCGIATYAVYPVVKRYSFIKVVPDLIHRDLHCWVQFQLPFSGGH